MKLSVIIPVYNEEGNIGNLVRNIHDILGSTLDYEMIVVDDCSTDSSVSEIDPQMCKILCHTENKGKGAAMKTGIEAASGDIIGFIDGDAQDDPGEMMKLVNEIRNGADLAIGSRFKKSSTGLAGSDISERYSKEAVLPVNEAGNRILTALVNKMFGAQFSDVCASFRFYRSNKLKQMKLESERYEIETEMAIRATRMKMRIVEVPVHRYPRKYGKSHLYQVPFGRVRFAFRILRIIVKGILVWR